MSKKYEVTDEELNLLLHYAGELYNVGTHVTMSQRIEREGNMDKELWCDGALYQLDKNYQEAYRLVNRLCPDRKLDGEIEDD